jgi:hypothetical protein
MKVGEPDFGDVDGEHRFDERVLVHFASEESADLFQMDFGGYSGADWRQYEKRIFVREKAANWEMHLSSEQVRNRVEITRGTPRFRPGGAVPHEA